MRVFCIIASHSDSGKTTTALTVIRSLQRRGFRVAAIKDIHVEGFSVDTPGKDTYLLGQEGASPVVGWAENETSLIFRKRLSLNELLRTIASDFVVVEGGRSTELPAIVVANSAKELSNIVDDRVFAISGSIASKVSDFNGLPALNALTHAEELTDLIVQKVPSVLPYLPSECCSACGTSCRGLLAGILNGSRKRSECVVDKPNRISLKVDDKDVNIVPFVQRLLADVLTAVVSNLDGYNKHSLITVKYKGEPGRKT